MCTQIPSSEPEVKPAGIVSNHCSWADILINLAHNCPSFAARDGTQSLPLIGTIRWVGPGKESATV